MHGRHADVLHQRCDERLFRIAAIGHRGNARELEQTAAVLYVGHDHVNRFATRYRLSPKEASLVRHALEGLNNDEAADALGCSRPTVSTYWNRIFRKTGVSGQRDLVILVMRGAHALPVIKTARDGSHARR